MPFLPPNQQRESTAALQGGKLGERRDIFVGSFFALQKGQYTNQDEIWHRSVDCGPTLTDQILPDCVDRGAPETFIFGQVRDGILESLCSVTLMTVHKL